MVWMLPGLVSCCQVLEALLSAIPIEAANTMGIPADDPYALHGDPPVWNDYRRIFKDSKLGIELQPIQKWDFYNAVASPIGWVRSQVVERSMTPSCSPLTGSCTGAAQQTQLCTISA